MKNLKIISSQRNGVMGDSFYVATATAFRKPFLITFDTTKYYDKNDIEDTVVNPSTCRAVCLSDLAEKWRGDDFAIEMNIIIGNRLRQMQKGQAASPTIYDLIETPKISTEEL